jgi:OPA family glycerol-3-phosphate transporter-like MFS transporter 3
MPYAHGDTENFSSLPKEAPRKSRNDDTVTLTAQENTSSKKHSLTESDPVLGQRNRNDGAESGRWSRTESPCSRPKAIGFVQAVLLPGVIPYSLGFAFLKIVHYAFFFWLPFYLTSALQWPEDLADEVSIWYDVGSILGGQYWAVFIVGGQYWAVFVVGGHH